MRNCGVDWALLRAARGVIQPPTEAEVAEVQERVLKNVTAHFREILREIQGLKVGEHCQIGPAWFYAGNEFAYRVLNQYDHSPAKNGTGRHCKLCDDGRPHSQILHEEFIMEAKE